MFLRRIKFPSIDCLRNSSRQLATTVDENELKHFNSFRSEWWNELGPLKALHAMNRLRVPFIRDRLIDLQVVSDEFVDTPKPLLNLNILDVGCGGGILSVPLAKLGGNVTGILHRKPDRTPLLKCFQGLDASDDLIEEAKRHAKSTGLANLNFVASSIETFSTDHAEKYDAVVMSEIIEHVSEKEAFLQSCTACLKPGGSVFVTTFNKTTIAWALGIVAAENLFSLIPRGTHEFDKFVSPHEVQRMLEEFGCRTALVHGMVFNPFTNVWSWTRQTCINYALHAVKSN